MVRLLEIHADSLKLPLLNACAFVGSVNAQETVLFSKAPSEAVKDISEIL